jgi:hypothetical protein
MLRWEEWSWECRRSGEGRVLGKEDRRRRGKKIWEEKTVCTGRIGKKGLGNEQQGKEQERSKKGVTSVTAWIEGIEGRNENSSV